MTADEGEPDEVRRTGKIMSVPVGAALLLICLFGWALEPATEEA